MAPLEETREEKA